LIVNLNTDGVHLWTEQFISITRTGTFVIRWVPWDSFKTIKYRLHARQMCVVSLLCLLEIPLYVVHLTYLLHGGTLNLRLLRFRYLYRRGVVQLIVQLYGSRQGHI
jgi:hypothetical protein